MRANRLQMIFLVAAASVALTACDAGPSSQTAANEPPRNALKIFVVPRAEDDDPLRTDPRRFQRRDQRTYQSQPNYQTVPDYGDYYVPDATAGQYP